MMRMEDFRDRVAEMVKELKGLSEVDETMSLIESGFLDSFDINTLIARIEEDFAIRIPGEDIIPENLNRYEDVASLIKRIKDE